MKRLKESVFGEMTDSRKVKLYTLTNRDGLRVCIIGYGAIIVSMEVPNRFGELSDITLGYDTLEQYLTDPSYFGAVVGRHANRIAGGRFVLNDVEYRLARNDGENHLHGGIKGFNRVVWKGDSFVQHGSAGVRLTYTSNDGEEGYPGSLSVTVTYILNDDDELRIEYRAETDKPTPVNLSQHSYFNLAGQGTGDILQHEVMLNADRFTPVNDQLIPTGETESVKDSPMDFTVPKFIGSEIDQVAGGYDHNYVLNDGREESILAASVYEPHSGRVMEVYTTEPGIQFYSGNFLDGSVTGKSGRVYHKHDGFCLETQHFPDSPNNPQFPSVILNPDESYTQETVLRFYARE